MQIKHTIGAILIAVLALGGGIYAAVEYNKKLTFVDGTQGKWSDYHGEWLVVNFFAEWCAPCLREMPELNEFHHQAEAVNAKLIGISFDPLTKVELQQLIERYQLTFPVLLDDSTQNMPIDWPQQLPTTWLIDPQGKPRKRIVGEVSFDKLQQLIKFERAKGV